MLVPFDYQVKAIDLAREAMRDPKRSAIICMLMGAGKTLVSLELMRLCEERGKRSLFLCDRRMLASQAVERAREQGLDAGIIMAGRGVDLDAPCQFASKQTVESWIKRDRIDLPEFDLLIVDECHRAVSPAYVKLFNKWPKVFRIGLTATPVLGNGNGMGAYYGRLIQPIKPSELRALNRIVPVRAFAPHVPDLTGVKKDKDGDYSARSLSERLTRSNLIGDVAGWWTRLAQGRPSIYFACDIAHAMAIRDEFRANGVTCEMICDQTPDDERDAIRNACESGSIKVVVNCDVLSEGIDWPFISCIGLVRPTKRLRRYLQNAGRGMRWLEGKIDCIIIDHAGCVPYHGFPDRDIEWPHDPCDNVDDLAKKKPATLPMRCANCSAMFQGSRTCPECGHVHIVEKKAKDYAQKNGTLVEFNGGDLPQETQTLLAQRFWGVCIGTAIKHNRAAGMAASMFSKKFGIPPWEAKVTPMVSGPAWKRPAREVFPGYVKGKQKVQHGDAWEG